jgi:SSS family solute:Na+ symporter
VFGTYDLIFFLSYMVIVLVIGFAVGRREKATVGDYFRAGNRLPWYAIGFSIIASGISSEQFVGEVGYAYKLGMPVMNWEWLVFPALSILLWIFVPLYVRNRVTTMPEYLQRRYGPKARTLYACLIVASYVFANFALVFYTGGFAIEQMWGFNKVAAVWLLAILTGAYTVYGGLTSVAWTDVFQCVLLLGGGLYVFFAGMARIGWDFAAVIGTGTHARLFAPLDHEVPWTALIILALSTNVWYYATDQFINQRCLGARNEWHAKMGVLLAAGLQLILPVATCVPGMIYFVMNPHLKDPNEAYTRVVAEVVPVGLRGLVVAAVLGAIMSTISGLVNSTATMVTLDIFRPWKGKDWSDAKLVRFGQWAGGLALLIGALFAPAVMKWKDIFRYCQDIWAPMAAPAVVVFMGGALWKGASQRGAVACLWLAILTVPLTFAKTFLADKGYHPLPENLENSLVFAGGVFLASIAILVSLTQRRSILRGALYAALLCVPITCLSIESPIAVAILILASVVLALGFFCKTAVSPRDGMWDRSMLWLPEGETQRWVSSLWLWWLILAAAFAAIYVYFERVTFKMALIRWFG